MFTHYSFWRSPPFNVTNNPSFTVNLGPVLPSLNVTKGQNGTGLDYNPRCLRRDISKYAANWTTTEIISDLILDHDNIWTFQNRLQGDATTGYVGIHSGGHYTIGGDPGGVRFCIPLCFIIA